VTPAPPVPASGAALAVPIIANRDCLWSARADADWLTVDPASGQGESTVTVSISPNPDGRTRSGRIVINDQNLQVAQDASPCRFEVEPRQLSVPHQGGRAMVAVTTLEGCLWKVSGTASWVRAIEQGGQSSGMVELGADGNTGAARSAALQVAGQTVTISQPAGPNDSTECRFSFTSGSANFAAAGGEGVVQFHTLPDCAWGAVSSQPWIVITTGSQATGTGPVVYTVRPNTTGARREGAIVAGGRQHVVRQAAR